MSLFTSPKNRIVRAQQGPSFAVGEGIQELIYPTRHRISRDLWCKFNQGLRQAPVGGMRVTRISIARRYILSALIWSAYYRFPQSQEPQLQGASAKSNNRPGIRKLAVYTHDDNETTSPPNKKPRRNPRKEEAKHSHRLLNVDDGRLFYEDGLEDDHLESFPDAELYFEALEPATSKSLSDESVGSTDCRHRSSSSDLSLEHQAPMPDRLARCKRPTALDLWPNRPGGALTILL